MQNQTIHKQTLTVDLGERSYPIFIGRGLLNDADKLLPYIKGKQVLVVSNTTVGPIYLNRILDLLSKNSALKVDTVVLPDGEEYKNLKTLNRIFTGLLESNHNRTTTIVALGGGVVGDMAGFAAASYQRGVDFIQVPTTLLSQVDSSVGGKTGVNHELGKNMIGAFHQPNCVLIDTEVLQTLPKREFVAGMAEVIKYGLIWDEEFWNWLEDHVDDLMVLEQQALTHVINRSCEIKAQVVAQDERESGIRAILNLGHTFGHAVETGLGYGVWLHGEAVGLGMMMAVDLSHRLGLIDKSVVERTEKLLTRLGLPRKAPKELTAERMLELMSVDKKVINSKLRLVLLDSLGHAIVTEDIDHDKLQETFSTFLDG